MYIIGWLDADGAHLLPISKLRVLSMFGHRHGPPFHS